MKKIFAVANTPEEINLFCRNAQAVQTLKEKLESVDRQIELAVSRKSLIEEALENAEHSLANNEEMDPKYNLV